MNTQYLLSSDPQTPVLAAEWIKKGELVAIPTETVYGLGANGLDETAVAKILQDSYGMTLSRHVNLG